MNTNGPQAKKEGSILGGVLLIAGSCIGAGMLAIPVITGIAGFIPSLFFFVLSWLFVTASALLLLEANLTLGYHLSIISIAEKTLGTFGKILCWVLFVFLFYSLGIAYVAASGDIVRFIVKDLFSVEIPSWIGSFSFTLIFGIVLLFGVKPVDYLNRLLMIGLVITYFTLVYLGSFHVDVSNLASMQWKYSFAAIPILIISFGYQNMIPSLADYFKGDKDRLRLTLIIGGIIPLLIYLAWEMVMLGIIPLHGMSGLLQALDKGEAVTHTLRAIVGKSWIGTVAQSFALFAITTSFLAQSLSLVDFLSDGLKIAKKRLGRVFLILLTLIPPFAFAYIYPGIFIRALNIAGGFSAVLLFGAIPALMVWNLRYRQKSVVKPLIPFGKPILILMILIALGIFLIELSVELGWKLIPQGYYAK